MNRSTSVRPNRVRSGQVRCVLVPVAALVLAVIAACGGDDTEGSSPSAGTGQDPTGTGPGQPTATVPAGAGRATLSEDPSAFLDQFAQEVLIEKQCDYDRNNGVVDCTEAGAGLIKLVPDVPEGADIDCRILLSQEAPVGVRCKGGDPLFAAVYELEE